MDKFLFKHIDNTGLVLWRVVFGALITIEAFGAIATGWVQGLRKLKTFKKKTTHWPIENVA